MEGFLILLNRFRKVKAQFCGIVKQNRTKMKNLIFYIAFIFTANFATASVELGGFTATQNKNHVALSWTTLSEENNQYFLIQKSTDGVKWDEVIRIVGTNKGDNVHHYNFNEYAQLKETHYYRLIQVDTEGEPTILGAIALKVKKEIQVKLYDKTIRIHAKEYEGLTMGIKDATGKMIKVKNLQDSDSMDVSELKEGVYFVTVFNDSEGLEIEKIELL